ncbi:family 78 glycoside hydrolase catalytic domain [Limisphaera sp. VF-2]|jgi:alpha-L-rhamnosidase|uniref:alpha-L-rhamnosidase n=1 Tax=Limisphaera sp. VF-2 TaxID=3400418 RepID=UPI0017512413
MRSVRTDADPAAPGPWTPAVPGRRSALGKWIRYAGFVCAGVWLSASPGAAGALRVVDLRCEGRSNPCGVDQQAPRLSWRIESDHPNVLQTAYHIQAASRPDLLLAGRPDLWDTGPCSSDQSLYLPYQGRPLGSHQTVWWRVRVWDNHGCASAWSQPASWTMGILDPDGWRAHWIGLEGRETTNWLAETHWIWHPQVPRALEAPAGTNWFRRVVTLPAGRRIVRAIFEYTGDNECRGWLNGRDLGARNNPRRVKWNDLTTRLVPGQTYVLGLTGRNEQDGKPAGVVGRLVVEFDSGPPLVVPTDAHWKVSDREEPGWQELNFDDRHWQNAQVVGPVGMDPWGPVWTAEDRTLPARYLRKEFALDRPVRRALLHWSGLGLSEVYLNGRRVGDAVLSPALSQYDRRVYYVSHEVTDLLRRGRNALVVILGNGRFYADRSRVYAGTISFGFPRLLLHLRIEHTDDSVTEIVSDETWRITDQGPIRANSEFDGEAYDARREWPGWTEPGFDDTGWQPAQRLAPWPGTLQAQPIEPIRVTQQLAPVGLTQPRPGVWIYDFGQNLVGWCRLRVRGPAGTTVQLRHAERLGPDGLLDMANLRGARQTDRYTLRGSGWEVYEPRFTYHGFRYVELTGYPGQPDLRTLTACVVHDDLRPAGDFACSYPLLNRIYQNVVWGVRGNYRSIPTDCPQRDERQGWLGDRSEECAGEAYLFDVANFYRKWMQDIVDAQRPSGSVPDVAPAYWPIYSDNVTWPSTLLIAPHVLYRQYADERFIAETYPAAVRWIRYMSQFVTNGLVHRDSYGDWCVPPEDPTLIHSRDPARRTHPTLIATAYFIHDLRLLARFARMLGREDEARDWDHQAGQMQAAFHQRFYDPERGQYDNGTQTSSVLPLALDLAPERERSRVFASLVRNIEEVTRGHIGTGLIGGQHLMRTLTRFGRADLAFRIATQTEYPGWGYMVRQGATTIWELWNGDTADPAMNSGNHVMLVGDLVLWLYECLAGIAPAEGAPGFKELHMRPHPVPGLAWVKARRLTPYGWVHSEWRRHADRFEWEVEVPPNSLARLEVPTRAPEQARVNGLAPHEAPGVLQSAHEAQTLQLRVGSGRYHIVCP